MCMENTSFIIFGSSVYKHKAKLGCTETLGQQFRCLVQIRQRTAVRGDHTGVRLRTTAISVVLAAEMQSFSNTRLRFMVLKRVQPWKALKPHCSPLLFFKKATGPLTFQVNSPHPPTSLHLSTIIHHLHPLIMAFRRRSFGSLTLSFSLLVQKSKQKQNSWDSWSSQIAPHLPSSSYQIVGKIWKRD